MGPATNVVIFNSRPICEGCGEVIELESLAKQFGEHAFRATKLQNGTGVEVAAICQNTQFHQENPGVDSLVKIFPAVNFPRASRLGRLTETLVREAKGATRHRILTSDHEELGGVTRSGY